MISSEEAESNEEGGSSKVIPSSENETQMAGIDKEPAVS